MVEGLSIREISDILSIPEATVKTRIHRAKAQLKDQLNPGGMPRLIPPTKKNPLRPRTARRIAALWACLTTALNRIFDASPTPEMVKFRRYFLAEALRCRNTARNWPMWMLLAAAFLWASSFRDLAL